MFNEVREELLESIEKYFPKTKVEIKERRSVVLEIRAYIDEETFIELYANTITKKRSFALILHEARIAGYDNYKFWHYHPQDNPEHHVQCEEPTVDFVIAHFKNILQKVKKI